jgi:hypothetical protein
MRTLSRTPIAVSTHGMAHKREVDACPVRPCGEQLVRPGRRAAAMLQHPLPVARAPAIDCLWEGGHRFQRIRPAQY